MKKEQLKELTLPNLWRVNSTLFNSPNLWVEAKTPLKAAQKYANYIDVVIYEKSTFQNNVYDFVVKTNNTSDLPHIIMVESFKIDIL
jgi:hypothetical protein